MDQSRYARQLAFDKIGKEGQQKLCDSRVAIIGMGALGTVSANNLCRAGVGYLRLIDRDFVEITNLQRQLLYDEEDEKLGLPKAAAAARHLEKINSQVSIDPIIADVNSSNIESFLDGIDLVLDASDNFEIRFLINEACFKKNIPWIYCGAVGSGGMTMNIIPGKTACFRCMVPDLPPAGSFPTCSTAGILNMITNIMGSLQSAEAVKMLVGSDDVRKTLLSFDVWNNRVNFFEIDKVSNCPTCGRHIYEYLEQKRDSYTTSLCGNNSVQVVPSVLGNMDFDALSEKLKGSGEVSHNPFMLTFKNDKVEIKLFKDGRAIILTTDERNAKSIYSEYIG